MYSKKSIRPDNSFRASNKGNFVKAKSSSRDSGYTTNKINNNATNTRTFKRVVRSDGFSGGQVRKPLSRTDYASANSMSHSKPRFSSPRPQMGYGAMRRPTFGSRPPMGGRGFGGGRRSGGRPVERIDYSKFINKPQGNETEVKPKKIEVKHKFADFKFDEMILNNLQARGYETPTPIQDQTIMHALKGQDVLGLANTGSGKTAAFLLPLIDKVVKDKNQKVMIIAPTRELAMQINKEFQDFAAGLKIFSTVCVGGMPIFRQIQNLRMINHFIIGTPGRIKDLAHRRCIDYSQFSSVVLDEVDHMLDMGFVDDITEILKGINPERQSLFFSATMPARIKTLVQKFQKDPFVIDITVPGSTKSVEQDIIKVDKNQKFETLVKLLEKEKATKTIIFVETKREVEEVAEKLRSAGLAVGYLHGDKRQRERARTLDQFKTSILNVLVATDVAARGIDISDISHVINYTIPQSHDNYVHRVGRAGRAGRTGKAFTFV